MAVGTTSRSVRAIYTTRIPKKGGGLMPGKNRGNMKKKKKNRGSKKK